MKSKGNKRRPRGTIINRLLDDDKPDVVMRNKEGLEVTFKIVYSTVEDGLVYVILAPLEQVSGMKRNEALLFKVADDETLSVTKDCALNNKIFHEYYETLKGN